MWNLFGKKKAEPLTKSEAPERPLRLPAIRRGEETQRIVQTLAHYRQVKREHAEDLEEAAEGLLEEAEKVGALLKSIPPYSAEELQELLDEEGPEEDQEQIDYTPIGGVSDGGR